MSKKKFDLSPYLDCYIHVAISYSEFLEKVKKTPFKIVDFDIQYAIEVLHSRSIRGTQAESKIAREILTQSGLSAFITKQASVRKTENPRWARWQQNPRGLIELIMDIVKDIQPIWDKNETDTTKGKKKTVSKILEHILEDKPSDKLIKDISQFKQSSFLTNLVISVLAETEGLSYSVLYKFYFDTHKDLKKLIELERQNKLPKRKGVEINKLRIKDKKVTFRIKELWDNPEEGVVFYREAYEIYKCCIWTTLPFLATKTERDKLLKSLS